MDCLHENIKQIYFGYLAAAFGSTRISSVYSIVDMAMMGQYPGPDGTATLTVAALWGKKHEVVGEYGYVKRRVFDYRYAAESADSFCNADDSRQLFSAGIQYG